MANDLLACFSTKLFSLGVAMCLCLGRLEAQNGPGPATNSVSGLVSPALSQKDTASKQSILALGKCRLLFSDPPKGGDALVLKDSALPINAYFNLGAYQAANGRAYKVDVTSLSIAPYPIPRLSLDMGYLVSKEIAEQALKSAKERAESTFLYLVNDKNGRSVGDAILEIKKNGLFEVVSSRGTDSGIGSAVSQALIRFGGDKRLDQHSYEVRIIACPMVFEAVWLKSISDERDYFFILDYGFTYLGPSDPRVLSKEEFISRVLDGYARLSDER